MIKYVPILRWKRGEQTALQNLRQETKGNICPLIEIPNEDFENLDKYKRQIETCLGNTPFYLQISSEWYDCEDAEGCFEKYKTIYSKLKTDNSIPVLTLTDIQKFYGSDVFFKEKFAIRIQNNEFESIEYIFESLKKEPSYSPNNIDIFLDLRYIYTDDLYAKITMLKVALMEIGAPSAFNSIIVPSCSFPRNVTNFETERVYEFPRHEVDIDFQAKILAEKHKFNYVYSDYGPSNLEDVAFVIGMSPNFKIKYSTALKYLFVKGKTVKKGGLDFDEISSVCEYIVGSSYFLGKDFSWGDLNIYNIAKSISQSGGNLTTWVSFAFNHHIELIVNSIK